MSGICHECGRRLRDPFGRVVPGVERLVDGTAVRMHKRCARRWDDENARITARATTDESGHTYVDDTLIVKPDGQTLRTVFLKPGEAEA